MRVPEALAGVNRLFWDTAPVIYYLEGNPTYVTVMASIAEQISHGAITIVTSPVTLAECLVVPYRLGAMQSIQLVVDFVAYGEYTEFHPINSGIAQYAAEIRARYNLALADAFQISVAIQGNCDTFLTNDLALRRIHEIEVLIIDELEP